MSKPITSIMDWPYRRESGVQTPVDILPKDALDIPIEDNASETPIDQDALDGLRADENISPLTIQEDTLYELARLRIDPGYQYRLLRAVAEFSRGTNAEDPTVWHALDQINGYWDVDTLSDPANSGLGTSTLILVDGVLDVVAKTFRSGEFQVSITTQVGTVVDSRISPRPVNAILLAYDLAESEDNVSIWGSNEPLGDKWTQIPLSGLSNFGWKNGQKFVSATGTTSTPSRTFLFSMTEQYMFYKVIFNQSITANMNVYEILALNFDGELGVSYEGRSPVYPIAQRFDVGIPGQSSEVLGPPFLESGVLDPMFDGWPRGDGSIDKIVDVATFEGDEVWGIVHEPDVSGDELASFVIMQVDDNNDITYAAHVELTHIARLLIYPTSEAAVAVASTDAFISTSPDGTSPFSDELDLSSLTDPVSDIIAMCQFRDPLASSDNIWALVNYNDGAAKSKIIQLTLSGSGPPVYNPTEDIPFGDYPLSSDVDAVAGMVHDGTYLYVFQTSKAPYWRKYDADTGVLVASRYDPIYGPGMNPIIFQVGGSASLMFDDEFLYCIAKATDGSGSLTDRSIMVKMTKEFGVVGIAVIPTTYDGIIHAQSHKKGDYSEFAVVGSEGGGGLVVRLSLNRDVAFLPVKAFWDLTDASARVLTYYFRAWSYSATGTGVTLNRLMLFNDTRGVRFYRPGTSGKSRGLTRIQLGGCFPNQISNGEPIDIAYTQSVTQFGTPRNASIFSKVEPRTEQYTIPAGGNSVQLLDRYGRPARYVFNALGDGMGSVGDSSFIPAVGSTVMEDEVAFGATMSSSGEYQINYELGVVYTFDTLEEETATFIAPDYGAFTIEHNTGTASVLDPPTPWRNFQVDTVAKFKNLQARVNFRTNLSLIDQSIATSKRIWVRIDIDRGTIIGTPNFNQPYDLGRGARASQAGRPFPLPQQVIIVTYLDVYGGYMMNDIDRMIVINGAPHVNLARMLIQLLSESSLKTIDIGLAHEMQAICARILQSDTTKHVDALPIVDPRTEAHIDNMPVLQASTNKKLDRLHIMLPFEANVSRDPRTIYAIGRKIIVEFEDGRTNR